MQAVTSVEEHGVAGQKRVHETPQIRSWGFDKKMEVVGHQAVQVHNDLVPPCAIA
jgi:hypothetical protein